MNTQKVKIRGKWKGSPVRGAQNMLVERGTQGGAFLSHRKVSAQTLWGPPLGKNEMNRNHRLIFSGPQAVRADVLTLNTKGAVLVPS